MRKLIAVVIVIALSGCTVAVTDQRITREELATAFQQRDQAIGSLAESMKKVIEKLEPSKK